MHVIGPWAPSSQPQPLCPSPLSQPIPLLWTPHPSPSSSALDPCLCPPSQTWPLCPLLGLLLSGERSALGAGSRQVSFGHHCVLGICPHSAVVRSRLNECQSHREMGTWEKAAHFDPRDGRTEPQGRRDSHKRSRRQDKSTTPGQRWDPT